MCKPMTHAQVGMGVSLVGPGVFEVELSSGGLAVPIYELKSKLLQRGLNRGFYRGLLYRFWRGIFGV